MKRDIILLLAILVLISAGSTSVFAAEIDSVSVKGAAGIEGVCSRTDYDFVTIDVTVKDSPEEPIEEDFTVEISGHVVKFSKVCKNGFSCTEASSELASAYDCSCSTEWCPERESAFSVRYDGQESSSSESAVLIPDYLPPKINSIAVKKSGANSIEVTYDLQDQGCRDCDTCSGLKSLEIIDNTAIGTIEFDDSDDSCFQKGSEVIDVQIEGSKDLVFRAKDKLWQGIDDDDMHMAEESSETDLDFTYPVIFSQWGIFKNDAEQSYMGLNGIAGVTAVIKIKEENLETVQVDLSGIGRNDDVTVTDSNYDDYCESDGDDMHVCRFPQINIGRSEEVSLDVRVFDEQGNMREQKLTKQFTVDSSGPVFVSLEKVNSYDGMSYISEEDNDFVARFTEEGSGFGSRNVYLILTQFDVGRNIQADRCEDEGNDEWSCYFENITLSGLSSESEMIGIASASTDDSGNTISGDMVSEFYVDTVAPEIVEFDAYGNGLHGLVPYFTSGDAISFEFEINTTGSPKDEFKIDISDLVEGEGNVSKDDCTEVLPDYYECSWSLSDKVRGGDQSASITLYASDGAGNTASETISSNVYGDKAGTPDNYDVKIIDDDMIPRKINRLIASTVPNPPGYKILVPFELKGGARGVSVIGYQAKDCKVNGLRENYNDIFRDALNPTPEPIRNFKTVSQVGEINFLEFIFSSSVRDLDSIDEFQMNCTFEIYETFGNTVYNTPEIENISIDFKLVDSAFEDEPSQTIIDKIETERERLQDTKFISDMGKWARKAQGFCNAADSVVMAWQSFLIIEELGMVTKSFDAGTIYIIGCVGYEGLGKVIKAIYYGEKGISNDFAIKNCFGNPQELSAAPHLLAKNKLKFKELMKQMFSTPTLRDFCYFVNCEHSTALTEGINRITGGNIAANLVEDGKLPSHAKFLWDEANIGASGVPNPTDSMILSAATICIPGMIYNAEKYQIIGCEYVTCLRDMAANGGDISICDAKKAESICIAITGEFTESIGIFRVIKTITNNFAQVLVNFLPNALKNITQEFICDPNAITIASGGEPTSKSFIKLAACDIPMQIYTYIDYYDKVKSVKNSVENMKHIDISGGETACKDIYSDDFWKDVEVTDFEE